MRAESIGKSPLYVSKAVAGTRVVLMAINLEEALPVKACTDLPSNAASLEAASRLSG